MQKQQKVLQTHVKSGNSPGKLRLVIDAVGIKSRGGAVVLGELLKETVGVQDIEHIYVLASPARYRSFELDSTADRTVVEQSFAETMCGRLWWAMHGLSRWARQIDNGVVLGLNGFGDGVRTPTAIFLQQPVPYYSEAIAAFPLPFRCRMRAIRWLQRRSARRAQFIIVQSEEFRGQVASKLGVPLSKIKVCLPGAPVLLPPRPDVYSRYTKLARSYGAKPILLYVGSDAPHKNLGLLGHALSLVPAECRPVCWLSLPQSNSACVAPNLIGLGSIPRDELAAVFASATALILPSLTETVGLPLLEAMAAGVPVLVSDRPYAHAICSDAALMFDPRSAADCADKIARLVTDAQLRQSKIARGLELLRERAIDENPYRTMMRYTLSAAAV